MRARSSREGLAVPISKSRYTATESQLTISPKNRAGSEMARADFPEAVGPRMTTRSGSTGLDGCVAIHRAPQGMVLPKRTNAMSRITSASTSRPVNLTRSRDFWRSYHSGVRGCCSRDGGGPEATAPFYAPQLLHIPFGGVVVKVEAQSQVRSVKFAGQGSKRIRCGDAAPGSAVESDVA